MKILMFSMTPLFADKSMGGAQKQLKKVAVYLAERGHEVTVLCTRRADAAQPFQWHERAKVLPLYRFKQPFPEPYETPPYNIAHAIQLTGDYLADADVFYNHDGGLIFPYIALDKPYVMSLRSVLFSETLQSGFLFQGDALILPSQHTAATWQHTAGRFFPELAKRIYVIHNGLDFTVYRHTPPKTIVKQLGLEPDRYHYILYPHRPEDAKGIRQTIAVVDVLVHQYALKNVRVLVPQWIDTNLSPSVREYYDGLMRDIDERGLRDYFVFHEWVSDSLMPEFYSVGAVTFALGNYVETFGNTPYESLACGTPCVVARVGAYRGMLPEHLVDLVDYGDVMAAAEAAYRIISQEQRAAPATLKWLYTHFSQETMVKAYADIILNAQKLAPMPYQHPVFTPKTRWMLAPWCFVSHGRVYHDFLGEFVADSALAALVYKYPRGFTVKEAKPARLQMWLDEGFVVPVPSK